MEKKDGNLLISTLSKDVWGVIFSLLSFRTINSLNKSCVFFRNLLKRIKYFENLMDLMVTKLVEKTSVNVLIYNMQKITPFKYCEEHYSFSCKKSVKSCERCRKQTCGPTCIDCSLRTVSCSLCKTITRTADLSCCRICRKEICKLCLTDCSSCRCARCVKCCETISKAGTSKHCTDCVRKKLWCKRCENRLESVMQTCISCGDDMCSTCMFERKDNIPITMNAKICVECVLYIEKKLARRKKSKV